jgi:hypothetical protein
MRFMDIPRSWFDNQLAHGPDGLYGVLAGRELKRPSGLGNTLLGQGTRPLRPGPEACGSGQHPPFRHSERRFPWRDRQDETLSNRVREGRDRPELLEGHHGYRTGCIQDELFEVDKSMIPEQCLHSPGVDQERTPQQPSRLEHPEGNSFRLLARLDESASKNSGGLRFAPPTLRSFHVS